MQLQIEKDVTPSASDRFYDGWSRRGEQLTTDLVEPAAVAEKRNKAERADRIRVIERDDRDRTRSGGTATEYRAF